MARPDRLVVAPYGRGATAALSTAVRAAQAGDPLAAVDVVVPTSVVAVTVRRAVAGSGLGNVRFSSLPQVAERLAARHVALTEARPAGRPERSRAARVALRETAGEVSAAAARHDATAQIVEGLLAELDGWPTANLPFSPALPLRAVRKDGRPSRSTVPIGLR